MTCQFSTGCPHRQDVVRREFLRARSRLPSLVAAAGCRNKATDSVLFVTVQLSIFNDVNICHCRSSSRHHLPHSLLCINKVSLLIVHILCILCVCVCVCVCVFVCVCVCVCVYYNLDYTCSCMYYYILT